METKMHKVLELGLVFTNVVLIFIIVIKLSTTPAEVLDAVRKNKLDVDLAIKQLTEKQQQIVEDAAIKSKLLAEIQEEYIYTKEK